ncbi:MAG: metal-dependent phosphohydrolase [Planctomycetota bacterium]
MSSPAPLLLDLSRRYCEPHRRYHTIGHIAQMLWQGRELALTDEQVMAIWYHDAIYRVPSRTNERDSAQLAVAQLTALGWPSARVDAVERMVLDTEGHEPTIESSAAVLDLDLASLAADWEVFDSNSADIRAEYQHLDEATYQREERAVFERFLARTSIFHTPWGTKLEAKARANLQRALGKK